MNLVRSGGKDFRAFPNRRGLLVPSLEEYVIDLNVHFGKYRNRCDSAAARQPKRGQPPSADSENPVRSP